MTIQEIIDRYDIKLEIRYTDGKLVRTGRVYVRDVRLMEKDNAQGMIRNHKEKILAVLNKQFDDEQRAAEERQKKIDSIEGLRTLQSALNDMEKWHDEFHKSFEDVGGLGVRPKPQYDIEELKRQYPGAAAYLLAESWMYSDHDVKSDAGRKAKEKIINGEDYNAAIQTMKEEWQQYVQEHMMD